MVVLLFIQQRTYYNSEMKMFNRDLLGGVSDKNLDCINFQNLHSRPVKFKWLQVDGARIECCVVSRSLALISEQQLLGEICRISPRFHSIIKITVLCNMLTNSHTRTSKCSPNIIISRVLNSAVRITMFTANYWCCKGGKLMHPLIKSDHKDRWTPRYPHRTLLVMETEENGL